MSTTVFCFSALPPTLLRISSVCELNTNLIHCANFNKYHVPSEKVITNIGTLLYYTHLNKIIVTRKYWSKFLKKKY